MNDYFETQVTRLSNDYMPTTREVEGVFAYAEPSHKIGAAGRQMAFWNWLDQYTREKQAQALRAAAGEWTEDAENMSVSDWLRARADELENTTDA